MYKVIKAFFDLKDNGFPYNVGDLYPRAGKEVSDVRIEALATDKNRQKTPLIKLVEVPKEAPKEEPKAEKPKKGAKK